MVPGISRRNSSHVISGTDFTANTTTSGQSPPNSLSTILLSQFSPAISNLGADPSSFVTVITSFFQSCGSASLSLINLRQAERAH